MSPASQQLLLRGCTYAVVWDTNHHDQRNLPSFGTLGSAEEGFHAAAAANTHHSSSPTIVHAL